MKQVHCKHTTHKQYRDSSWILPRMSKSNTSNHSCQDTPSTVFKTSFYTQWKIPELWLLWLVCFKAGVRSAASGQWDPAGHTRKGDCKGSLVNKGRRMEATGLKISLMAHRCKHHENTGKLGQSTAASKLPSYCPSSFLAHGSFIIAVGWVAFFDDTYLPEAGKKCRWQLLTLGPAPRCLLCKAAKFSSSQREEAGLLKPSRFYLNQ